MTAATVNLPSTPLELQRVTDCSSFYVQYWDAQLQADHRLEGARELSALVLAGSKYVRDNPDDPPAFPGPSRQLPFGMGSSPAFVIENWDRGLGPFNHLQGAGGDLLRGAAMVLQNNQIGQRPHFPTVTLPEPRSVADAFLNLAEQIPISRQRPSTALLLGAQLVHKAAWIERDADRQSGLFEAAAKMYERIYNDPNMWWNMDKLKAGQYLADIRFHELGQRIRRARQEGQSTNPLRREAVRLLQGQARDLLNIPKLHITNEPDEPGYPARVRAGAKFEMLAAIAVRHLAYVSTDMGGTQLEIRTAFASEDRALEPVERKVDSKFDLVLDRLDTRGAVVAAEPWQTKLGNSPVKGRRPYHPAIRVIKGKKIGNDLMVDAARGLLEIYEGGQYEGRVTALAPIREVIDPYLETATTA